jgi:hypothetical protein
MAARKGFNLFDDIATPTSPVIRPAANAVVSPRPTAIDTSRPSFDDKLRSAAPTPTSPVIRPAANVVSGPRPPTLASFDARLRARKRLFLHSPLKINIM